MTIHVLGSNGMLGRYVFKYLSLSFPDVVGYTRNEFDATLALKNIPIFLKKNDVVVNCIGLIPQRGDFKSIDYVLVNSVFPLHLADICEAIGARLIHATTDCVFSGKTGGYTEASEHDALDFYGKTKSLGEPKNATVIRTSIIGEELQNKRSLLEWVRSKNGEIISGYANHVWNGITCLQFAKVCEDIIKKNAYWVGVRHIFSPTQKTKYNLVKLIVKVYGLDIKVNPVSTGGICDKTLGTLMESNKFFHIPELEVQINQQRNFVLT